MNYPIPRTLRLFVAALFGTALFMASVQPSVAQKDGPPSLINHLRSELQSDDAKQRQYALVDVIALANCPETCTVSLRSIEEKKLSIANETGTGAVVELAALIPDLLEVYRRGPADGHRLLALSALVNIGNLQALEKLVEEGESQSETTKRATHRSLVAFYLDKYPDLTERTFKTKSLSIEDVRRAEILRLRALNEEG